MRFSAKRIRELAASRGLSLSALLREAGVSRTAYYSLARRESAFPKSVSRLADTLGVTETDLFEAVTARRNELDPVVAEARRIAAKHPGIEFENIWHTLLVLRETPLQRLQGSLRRGRAAPLW
jgi:transcriptional regulator with XRE-family HTH domain